MYRQFADIVTYLLLIILLLAMAFFTGWSVHAIFYDGGILYGSLWLAFVCMLWFVVLDALFWR